MAQDLAVGFGIGMGLTLDEFALWLELGDVYWLPQGRKSIDAVIVAATAGALLLLGVRIWIDLADGTAALVELVVTGSAAVGVAVGVVNALRARYVARGTDPTDSLAARASGVEDRDEAHGRHLHRSGSRRRGSAPRAVIRARRTHAAA